MSFFIKKNTFSREYNATETIVKATKRTLNVKDHVEQSLRKEINTKVLYRSYTSRKWRPEIGSFNHCQVDGNSVDLKMEITEGSTIQRTQQQRLMNTTGVEVCLGYFSIQ